MFGMQLYDSFTVCLFMIFERGLSFGKCFPIRCRNFLPKSVDRFAANGGLNLVTFLFL